MSRRTRSTNPAIRRSCGEQQAQQPVLLTSDLLFLTSIAFYISGHGFGHASRQIEIINAVANRVPDPSIIIRTSAPRWLFDRTVRRPFRWYDHECDTGITQIDSLHIDEGETVRRAARFYAAFDDRVALDAKFLTEQQVQLVVSDAPPLACAAAARAGVPAILIGNFTWDWIYAGYPDRFAADAPTVIPMIGDAYRQAMGAMRLPMHGGFETITPVTDVPFVARHARADLDRVDVLSLIDLPGDRPLALSSFGGYGLSGLDLSSLDCLRDWTIVMTGNELSQEPPDGLVFVQESAMYDAGLRYEDLVGVCDVVVTKPGYGIISECIANDTAILYTSRGHFREYDVLVAEMPRFLRCAFIDNESLLGGRWLDALDGLLECPPPPERARTDGADVVAEMIAAAIDSRS
jgi:L-arabinokinase